MPEETTPPEGTPSTPEAPNWDSPDNPYLKRFQDTQSAYTQNQQRLKELERYEQDPQAYYELGAKHGVEFQFEEPNEGVQADPYAQQLTAYEQRIAQLEARAQSEQAAAGEELFHQDLDGWAEADGVKLSKADHNAIFGLLLQTPGIDPTQEAAARQVYEAHVADKKAEREAIEQEIRSSLGRPRVPTPPTGGTTATGTPNWGEMTESEINEYMAARIAGNA